MEVDAQKVIDALLEQNKQLMLEVAVLRAQLGIETLDEAEEDR